jgi:hypothetical protein
MQGRRHILICMNPITTKDEIEVTLCLSDEECHSQRLAPNGELHRDDAFSSHQLASSHTADSHVGLD